jgi:hypothetical protein
VLKIEVTKLKKAEIEKVEDINVRGELVSNTPSSNT